MLGNHNHNSESHASGSCACQVLADFKVNGKARPWRERKAASRAVAKAYERLAEKTHDEAYQRLADRMYECGNILDVDRIRKADGGTRRRVTGAKFCRSRLCAMCQWRRSLENAKQLEKVVEAHWFGAEGYDADGVQETLQARPRDKALLLTVTAKNVKGKDLPAEIIRLCKAFDRMRRTKRLQSFVTGWFRSLEVTYNSYTRTYHPHFHILLMVKPDYTSNPNYYLDQKAPLYEWSKLWAWAADLNYRPVVDVRMLNGGKGGQMNEDVRKGMRELTKYCTKPLGFITEYGEAVKEYSVEPEVLKALHESLKGRRLFGWGGNFKEARRILKLQDVESEDADLLGSSGLAEGETVEAREIYGFKYSHELKRYDYLLLYELPPLDNGGGNARGKAQRPPDRRERGEPQTLLH